MKDSSSPAGAAMRRPPPPSTGFKWRVTKEYWLQRLYKDLDEQTKMLVDDMTLFAKEFRQASPDLYWHRKSGLVVLAVLLIKCNGQLKTVRGINSELSLPSGSVCAERAAIVAALSQNLSLNRSDFVSIAVLAPNNANPIKPCGVCCEWIRKIEAVSPTFTVVTFTSALMNEILEYSSVTVSEEMIDTVPDHLKGNWVCRCGFELNRAQQAFCTSCKQFKFKFKTHLHTTRVRVLRAIKRHYYPDDPAVPSCPVNVLATPLPPTWAQSDEETEGETAALQLFVPKDTAATPTNNKTNRSRRKSSTIFIANDVIDEIAQTTSLPVETMKKTVRDLLSLKFIEKTFKDQNPTGGFIITSLGSDFLEASSKA